MCLYRTVARWIHSKDSPVGCTSGRLTNVKVLTNGKTPLKNLIWSGTHTQHKNTPTVNKDCWTCIGSIRVEIAQKRYQTKETSRKTLHLSSPPPPFTVSMLFNVLFLLYLFVCIKWSFRLKFVARVYVSVSRELRTKHFSVFLWRNVPFSADDCLPERPWHDSIMYTRYGEHF